MGFIDPRTDFGFKRIFGSTRSKPILKSLLNAFIYDGEPRIRDLEILDPYQNPSIYDLKQSILDIKATLDNGELVLIEMQVIPVEAFVQRVIYNTAKAYVNQLKRGQGYIFLKPVIAVTITDFVLFHDTESPLSRYQLREPDSNRLCSDHFELIFAELPKFHKMAEELQTLSDRWLYFLQQAGLIEEAPTTLTDDPDFDAAFEIANESQLSPEELGVFEKQRQSLLDEQGRLGYALRQGREEGARQREREIARELLKTLPAETVVQVTGLSAEEVAELTD